MRNYNFTGPILIIAVAFLAKSLSKSIALLLGADPDSADSISTFVMVIAAILAYIRLTKQRKNNHKK